MLCLFFIILFFLWEDFDAFCDEKRTFLFIFRCEIEFDSRLELDVTALLKLRCLVIMTDVAEELHIVLAAGHNHIARHKIFRAEIVRLADESRKLDSLADISFHVVQHIDVPRYVSIAVELDVVAFKAVWQFVFESDIEDAFLVIHIHNFSLKCARTDVISEIFEVIVHLTALDQHHRG